MRRAKMISNWHEWRRQGIGGSDAPVVMGVSPWTTPHQLWQEKVYGSLEREDNSAMKRGRELEEFARQEFEKEVGTLVIPEYIVHPKLNWMRASLDGIDLDREIIVEIKCPNKEDHEKALKKMVPEKYWPQVQHQMEVAGVDHMYYYSFDGLKGVVVEVKKDQAYVDSLLEKEAKFWDMVLKKTPPELTDRDYVAIDGSKEWEKAAREYLETDALIKALEDKKTSYRGIMISLSQGRNAVGSGVKLQRQLCKGLVDYSSIPELKGVDLEPYRKKPFEKWVVRSA
jgi:putative phage-type endonuclease